MCRLINLLFFIVFIVLTCLDLLFLPFSRFVFCILPLLLFVHLSALIARPFHSATFGFFLFSNPLFMALCLTRSSNTSFHTRNSPVPIYFDISRLTLSNPFLFLIDFFSFSRSSFMSEACIYIFFTSSPTIYYNLCHVSSIPHVSCRISCKIHTLK